MYAVIRRSRPRKRVDVDTEPQTAEPVTVKKSPEPAVKADRWAAERERMRQHKAQPVVEQKPWWKPQLEFTDEDCVKPLYGDLKKEEK
jgi:acyl-CoA synthetase (NDP forming)